jgi:hypothetical protein
VSTTLTPAQLDALKKLQTIQQQQALDSYLSGRATQYGATPKGAKADTGWTAGESLANPFAGLTDFGKKQVPVYGTDEQISNVVGEEEQAKTASDLMREKFGEQLGHKTTFTKAYKKDEKGNPVEVELDSLTPEEINSGNVVLFMGGKTGGTERERMAQAYIPKGDKLIPVGDPTYYKGEHPDAKNVATALKVGSLLSMPFGGAGALLGGASSTLAGGLASFLPEAAAKVAGSALTSGLASGVTSKLTGGDFSKGFKSGAISGAVGSGIDQFAGDTFKNMGQFGVPAKSIATSGVTSLLTGQKFDPTTAVKNAAINYGLNQAGQAVGVDPKQQAALMRGLNFMAPMIAARKPRKP